MRTLALSSLLLTLAACNRPTEVPKTSGPAVGARKPIVTFGVAAPKDIEYAIEATGTIEAADEVSIPARVSGVVDTLKFKEGDLVNEETLLMEIEVRKYGLAVERIQADLERALAQQTLAETVYGNRKKLYEEGKKLKKDFVTEEQMASVGADLERARADVKRVRADLALAKLDYEHSSVRPPIAGLINGRFVAKGEYVKAETVVATILDVSSLHVCFTVPELEASRLKLGDDVQFAIRSFADRWFRAKLFYMSQKADPATRAVECKAEVTDRNDSFRTGVFASVRIVTERVKSVVLPGRAVLPTEKGFVVFVADDKNVVKSRVIELGLRTPDGVEVRKGLEAGEKFVDDGAASLRDGVTVEEKK